jgi:colanic acid biosynthesis protein WcaH
LKLDDRNFLEVVRSTPLVSIDLIVRDSDGHILVGMRNNEPARGTWFVPGGRIYKDETVSRALSRISQAELGIELSDANVRFLDVYDHLYDTNFAEVDGVSTHYVVLAYEIARKLNLEDLPGEQHSRWAWVSRSTDKAVHPNTLAYLPKEQ